jgi:hypothetical protein
MCESGNAEAISSENGAIYKIYIGILFIATHFYKNCCKKGILPSRFDNNLCKKGILPSRFDNNLMSGKYLEVAATLANFPCVIIMKVLNY